MTRPRIVNRRSVMQSCLHEDLDHQVMLRQRHEKILIYNFSMQDTIDAIILSKLHSRINIFQSYIGDLEAILGDRRTPPGSLRLTCRTADSYLSCAPTSLPLP